jgi:hypothetical protein
MSPTSNATWLVSVSRADRASQTSFGKVSGAWNPRGQADHRKHSCRSPASGRDGCCRFSLRKSEEVMGIKIRAFKESLLGIVKVFEDAGY